MDQLFDENPEESEETLQVTEDNATEDAGQPQEDDFFSGDPSQLPEDLQPYYKSMLTDYRRKTQEIAELRKGMEGVDVNALKTKADHFDRMTTDPQYRAQVMAALNAGQPSGPTEPSHRYTDKIDLQDDDQRMIKELAYQAGREVFMPEIERLQAELRAVQGNMARSEWDAIVESNPSAQQHLNEVSEFLQASPGFETYWQKKGLTQRQILKKALHAIGVEDAPRKATTRPRETPPQTTGTTQEDRSKGRLTSSSGPAPREVDTGRGRLVDMIREARQQGVGQT